ncbi:hypothetical protein, partial [Muriicola sp.]|uniref:hypothetical protein n=1 Tax=Muriicola sp. TaxID=2020856 RepID=UPI003C762FBA
TEYINNTTLGGVNSGLPDNVQGSPYANEEFVIGKVFVNDQAPYSGILRYNAYQDGIEMKTEKGIITLLKRDYLRAEIAGKLYLIENYISNGAIRKTYFVEVSKGKARLLLKQGKKFVEERQATSSYSKDQPAKFEDETSYYIITEGKPAIETRLRTKDVLAALPEHNKEVAAFVKKNKLKMKTEEEVMQVLAYYNSL